MNALTELVDVARSAVFPGSLARRALLRLVASTLLLPAWLLLSIESWRARRRLRAYGPAAILALSQRPRLLH